MLLLPALHFFRLTGLPTEVMKSQVNLLFSTEPSSYHLPLPQD